MNAVISGARIPHIAYLVVPHTVSTSGLSGPRARYSLNGVWRTRVAKRRTLQARGVCRDHHRPGQVLPPSDKPTLR